MKLTRAVTGTVTLSGQTPPSEFRLFRSGINQTSKGVFVFDAAAAKAVMVDYAAHGNELSIDYAHAALGAANSANPSQAGKAAGWFKLEVRNGELWATAVRWTPAAATALASGEWRYTSPVFPSAPIKGGKGARRILAVINCALTNIPATHQLTPLMAASKVYKLESGMDPALIKKLLEIIQSQDGKAALEALNEVVASAAGAGSDVPADPADEPALMGDPAAEDPADGIAAVAAQRTELQRERSLVSRERAQLERDRAAFESAERDALGVELITSCGRNPAAVWADPLVAADPKKRKLRKALAVLSLEDLRSEVELSRLDTALSRETVAKPPVRNADEKDEFGLTTLERKIATENKIEPALFAVQLKRFMGNV